VVHGGRSRDPNGGALNDRGRESGHGSNSLGIGHPLNEHWSPVRRLTDRLLMGMLSVLLAGTPSWARSPLAAEVGTFSTRYHERLSRIDTIREELERATNGDGDVDDLIALAQVCFIWGDVRATTSAQKLEAYDEGRTAAKRAVELDPRNAAAHFWYGTNTARWGQTKGVVRSLFLLSTVQEEIQTVLGLDPKFTAVYALAGNVLYEVPPLLGGDLRKAEEMFRTGLEQDPKFTAMRVGLAKTLIKQGRIAEARQELQAVLDEKNPRNMGDWVMKDTKTARALLQSLR
jgi:tetratricopeptide (TPR) repeat protein